ncbi:MAG: hypothetical protein AAF657_20415 [Acidobacteriota bacterium]
MPRTTSGRLVMVAWAAGLSGMVHMASRPNPYLLHVREIPPPHPFPWLEVAILGGFMTAEAFLLWAAVEPSVRLGIGPVAATVLFGLMSFAAILGSMHSSNAYGWHLMWLLALTLVTFLVALGSGVRKLVATLGRR